MKDTQVIVNQILQEMSELEHIKINSTKILIGNIWFLDRADIENYVKRSLSLILTGDEATNKEAMQQESKLVENILQWSKKNIGHFKNLSKLEFYYDDINSEKEEYFFRSQNEDVYLLRPSAQKGHIVFSIFYNEEITKKLIPLEAYTTYQRIALRPSIKAFTPEKILKTYQNENSPISLEQKRQFLCRNYAPTNPSLEWVIANNQITLVKKMNVGRGWIKSKIADRTPQINDLRFKGNIQVETERLAYGSFSGIRLKKDDIEIYLQPEFFGYRLINHEHLLNHPLFLNARITVTPEDIQTQSLVRSLEDLAEATGDKPNIRVDNMSSEHLKLIIHSQSQNKKFFGYLYQLQHAYLLIAQLTCIYNELLTIHLNRDLKTDNEKYKRTSTIFNNFILYLQTLAPSYLQQALKIKNKEGNNIQELYQEAETNSKKNSLSINTFNAYIKKVQDFLIGENVDEKGEDISWENVWLNVLKQDLKLPQEIRNEAMKGDMLNNHNMYLKSSKRNVSITPNVSSIQIQLFIPKSNDLINRFKKHIDEALEEAKNEKLAEPKGTESISVCLNRVVKYLNLVTPLDLNLRWQVSNSMVQGISPTKWDPIEVSKQCRIEQPNTEPLRCEVDKSSTKFVYSLNMLHVKQILNAMLNMEECFFSNIKIIYQCCEELKSIMKKFGPPETVSEAADMLVLIDNLTQKYNADFALDFCIYYGYMIAKEISIDDLDRLYALFTGNLRTNALQDPAAAPQSLPPQYVGQFNSYTQQQLQVLQQTVAQRLETARQQDPRYNPNNNNNNNNNNNDMQLDPCYTQQWWNFNR